MRSDAPDQIVHGRQRGIPLLGLGAMLEAGQQQHLAPGFLQQANHDLRKRLAKQAFVQYLLDFLARHLCLGAALFGVAGALFEQLAAAALVAGEGQEVGEQLGEDSGIVDEVVEQACHHLFDLLVETVALGFVLIAPAHGCGGDLVEQATGRMAATAEEGLVQHGDLEQRDLQAADQRLERVRQGAVVEDELEQHRNQVDDIFVDFANHARLAALGADLVQQLFELALQVEVVD